MATSRPPLTMQEQANLIDRLVARTVMHGGKIAGETIIALSEEDANDLVHLSMRLARMVPHEERIRRIVMGK